MDEVSQVAASAHSAVAAEYRGLTVGELTELREEGLIRAWGLGVNEWQVCDRVLSYNFV